MRFFTDENRYMPQPFFGLTPDQIAADDGVLDGLCVVKADDVSEVEAYQPFANFTTFDHPLSKGLRPNARQLVESAVVGYASAASRWTRTRHP